jgi:hypothetical protein
MPLDLPPGLNPVQAGRLGLWLLSKRSHKAAQKRIAFPQRDRARTLVGEVADLLFRWRCAEYPGQPAILSAILGIAPGYAANLLKPSWRLPAHHARTLADYLDGHIAECHALAVRLREHAAKPLPPRKSGGNPWPESRIKSMVYKTPRK